MSSSGAENIVLYDWLSFTSKNHTPEELIDALGLSHVNWTVTKGARGYRDRKYFSCISIHYNGRPDMGVWVEMSGQGCRAFESLSAVGWEDLFLFIRGNGLKITRLDVAYMALHQQDENANLFWIYFKRVIEWVQTIFPVKRKEMKGLEWGLLYNQFKDITLDPDKLETEIKALMIDVYLTNKKGIYPYVLTRDERHLNIRAFTEKQKREAYERQNGICPDCGKHFSFEEMQVDHITPLSKGGLRPRITAKCAVRTATVEKAIHNCLHLFSSSFEWKRLLDSAKTPRSLSNRT